MPRSLADGRQARHIRVAPRPQCSVSYLLSDQLGSTSITANGNGGFISELRYRAWGEVRYTSGTTPTKYAYTGQYSNMGDFGLMFYNARWYDPTIGRFVQADTVVPDGVQGYDRFAYANNDPVLYNDPSGHCIWDLCIVESIGVVEILVGVGAVAVTAHFYANTPPPPALANSIDAVSQSASELLTSATDELHNQVKGEYIPAGLHGVDRWKYRDAVERYKKSHGIPRNVNVPKDILDKIADDIREGKSPLDAVDGADEPPDNLEKKGKPKSDTGASGDETAANPALKNAVAT